VADDETPAADDGLDQRVTQLETGQQSILSRLDQLIGGDDTETTEPERPEVNIAEEIRRQLGERDKAAARKPKAAAAPKAAELAEQAPEPMGRRIEKIMGWAE
jgi:hypothetical protein